MVSVDITQYFNNINNSTESIRLIRDKEKGGRGMEVGEAGDYTPIATLSPNAVLETRRLNICYRDARFCRQQEQTCGLQTTRTDMWPAAVQLHTKLYDSEEELEKTASFILQSGLSVVSLIVN